MIYICCFRFPCLLEYSLSALKDFIVSLWIRCLLFHISWFLETYCLFQIFRWRFTTPFRFPWRSIACCSRFPCLLEYSLSAVQDFLECSLPLPNLSYFLKDSPPAPNAQSLSQRRSKMLLTHFCGHICTESLTSQSICRCDKLFRFFISGRINRFDSEKCLHFTLSTIICDSMPRRKVSLDLWHIILGTDSWKNLLFFWILSKIQNQRFSQIGDSLRTESIEYFH